MADGDQCDGSDPAKEQIKKEPMLVDCCGDGKRIQAE